MNLAVLVLLFSLRSPEMIYHVSVQGATQTECKITHKATAKEPWIDLTCKYRCQRPLSASVNVKDLQENIYCRDPISQRATTGKDLSENNSTDSTEEK